MRHETSFPVAPDLAASVSNGAVLAHRSDGSEVFVDMWRLKAPHTFIQGGTGSGKSTAGMAMIEPAHAAGMALAVFDLEGQFGKLRESCPGVIVIGGDDGDLPLDPATIGAVMAEAFRSGASFVIRLHEHSVTDQRKMVADGLRVLMDMPRKFWGKRLIVIDEVHVIAPQNGFSEATEPLAQVAARGRRRGYRLLVMTQRIAWTHKNVITQCLNLAAGRNRLGADLVAVCEALGLSRGEAQRLQKLPQGTFLATGPDFAEGVDEIRFVRPDTVLERSIDDEDAPQQPLLSTGDMLAALRRVAASSPDSSGEDADADIAQHRGGSPDTGLSGVGASTAGLGQQLLAVLAAARVDAVPLPAIQLLFRAAAPAAAVTKAIAELRGAKLVAGRKRLALTPAGRKRVASGASGSTLLCALLGDLRRRLDPDARRILDALSAAAGQPLPVEEIAVRTAFSARSRKLRQHLDWLSRRGLIRKRAGAFTVSDGYAALATL